MKIIVDNKEHIAFKELLPICGAQGIVIYPKMQVELLLNMINYEHTPPNIISEVFESEIECEECKREKDTIRAIAVVAQTMVGQVDTLLIEIAYEINKKLHDIKQSVHNAINMKAQDQINKMKNGGFVFV